MENLDSQDQKMLAVACAEREKIEGPRLGDFVLFPSGQLERFSHELAGGMQTSPGGAFFLGTCGQGSLSCGGSNPPTPMEQLELTRASLPGSFWFFHHGVCGSGRGVYFDIPCRVFTTTAPYTGFLGSDFQLSKMATLKQELEKQMARQLH